VAAPGAREDAPASAWGAGRLLAVIGLAVAVQAAVWALLWYLLNTRLYLVDNTAHWPYWFFDVSDTYIYWQYALSMVNGQTPYLKLALEYPPLAVPVFLLPAKILGTGAWMTPATETTTGGWMNYARQFAFEMMVASTAAGALTAAAATRLWRGRQAWIVAAAYGGLVIALGAITANRYDAVVACVFAAALLLLAARRWEWAGLVLGIGFALKLTPVILLPLVFVLAWRRRTIIWTFVLFSLAAVLPFVYYAVRGTAAIKGLWHVFSYHLHRPLQLESVAGTPYWIGHLFGWIWIETGNSYGSQFIAARGTDAVAKADSVLLIAGLGLVYWLIWRRRETLRATPQDVPLAVLALVLAFLVFGKVLSPQYFVWTLPAIALVIVRRPVLGGLLIGVLVLTHIEFPKYYWKFVDMETGPLLAVIARNILLAAAFVLSLVELWRLPAGPLHGTSRLGAPQRGKNR
jgi:hypothetical protein